MIALVREQELIKVGVDVKHPKLPEKVEKNNKGENYGNFSRGIN